MLIVACVEIKISLYTYSLSKFEHIECKCIESVTYYSKKEDSCGEKLKHNYEKGGKEVDSGSVYEETINHVISEEHFAAYQPPHKK
jgi:hypothetical protein